MSENELYRVTFAKTAHFGKKHPHFVPSRKITIIFLRAPHLTIMRKKFLNIFLDRQSIADSHGVICFHVTFIPIATDLK